MERYETLSNGPDDTDENEGQIPSKKSEDTALIAEKREKYS